MTSFSLGVIMHRKLVLLTTLSFCFASLSHADSWFDLLRLKDGPAINLPYSAKILSSYNLKSEPNLIESCYSNDGEYREEVHEEEKYAIMPIIGEKYLWNITRLSKFRKLDISFPDLQLNHRNKLTIIAIAAVVQTKTLKKGELIVNEEGKSLFEEKCGQFFVSSTLNGFYRLEYYTFDVSIPKVRVAIEMWKKGLLGQDMDWLSFIKNKNFFKESLHSIDNADLTREGLITSGLTHSTSFEEWKEDLKTNEAMRVGAEIMSYE